MDMDDLTITKLCAIASEVEVEQEGARLLLVNVYAPHGQRIVYDPLHDDADCFALVRRFKLHQRWNSIAGKWLVEPYDRPTDGGWSPDLNRAVCECVANMHKSQEQP
jgi:hypothetical protein